MKRNSAKWNSAVLMLAVVIVGVGFIGQERRLRQRLHSYMTTYKFSSLPKTLDLNAFSMSVYNSTGGIVASSESPYPAFSFELPSGNYLFTAIAGSDNYVISPPIALGATASGSSTVLPRGYYGYQEEYGYIQTNLNSSKSIRFQQRI